VCAYSHGFASLQRLRFAKGELEIFVVKKRESSAIAVGVMGNQYS
jgi:hypothetical protein